MADRDDAETTEGGECFFGSFARSVVDSQLLTEAQIEEYLRHLPPKKQRDDNAVARHLVNNRRLTSWQARRLLNGNSRGFFIGRYKLLDHIGKGGIGTVYRAEQTMMRQQVALKVLNRNCLPDEDSRARFVREIGLSAQLKHPNLVTTYYADNQGNVVYFAMELISGSTFLDHVRQHGPLSFDDAVRLIRQVADGLHYVHTHPAEIVHRDIKPNNIMLTGENEARILDLGMARAMGKFHHDSMLQVSTKPGMTLGTPLYMSPEQVRDSKSADARTDIYALGCTLFYLLTAKHPVDANNAHEAIAHHLDGRLRPLSEHRRDTPDWLLRVHQRMVQHDAAARYASCEELLRELRPPEVAPARVAPARTAQAGVAGPVSASRPSSEERRTLTLDGKAGVQLEMIRVPGGRFMSGCSQAMAEGVVNGLNLRDPDAAVKQLMTKVLGERELAEYWITRFPITNRQYACFVRETRADPPPNWPAGSFQDGAGDLPVVGVTISDARAFCKWAKLLVPTIEQWEKAARGTDGRIYPWGNEFDPERCNCAENGGGQLADVSRFESGDSPFGVRQATGNVWEWVEAFELQPQLRGGSMRSTCQFYGTVFTPMKTTLDFADIDVGFRAVMVDAAATVARRMKKEDVKSAVEANLIEIPAGPFLKGLAARHVDQLSRSLALDASAKQKLLEDGSEMVSLPSYSIGQFCVSNEQYLVFVQETRHNAPKHWPPGVVDGTFSTPSNWRRLPVAGVSFDDARAFCEWVDCRLPSREEWEKAARGTDGRLYPWGNEFNPTLCNTGESEYTHPLAVDSLPAGASPYDLFNCTGNVMEWCSTFRGRMAATGGGAYSMAGTVYGLCGFPVWVEATMREPTVGFRVAR